MGSYLVNRKRGRSGLSEERERERVQDAQQPKQGRCDITY